MYPVPGHLSVSSVLAKTFNLNIGVVVLAGFFPDIFDKPLYWILNIFPNGRTVMHSLSGLLVMFFLVYLYERKKIAIAWGFGHFGHLICDFSSDLILYNKPLIPWLFPFKIYEFPPPHYSVSTKLLLIETGLLFIAIFVVLRPRLRKRRTDLDKIFN